MQLPEFRLVRQGMDWDNSIAILDRLSCRMDVISSLLEEESMVLMNLLHKLWFTRRRLGKLMKRVWKYVQSRQFTRINEAVFGRPDFTSKK